MLFLLRELYDLAVHLSSEEYKEKTGQDMDTQSVIEAPQLYFMGASGAKDCGQLSFLPTRRECLKIFKHSEINVQGNQVV